MLSTTDQRYLRTALSTIGRTILRLDEVVLRVAVERVSKFEVKATIHNNKTGELLMDETGQSDQLMPTALHRIQQHHLNLWKSA